MNTHLKESNALNLHWMVASILREVQPGCCHVQLMI